MKDGKEIIIENENLRNLRYNLRSLIKKAMHIKYRQRRDEIRKLLHIREYGDGIEPTVDEKQKAQELKNANDILKHFFQLSIVYCRNCKSWDKDMKFFAPWNEWTCVDCYDDVVKKYMHVEKLARERKEHGLL
jgi:hypothetical protein